MNSGATPDPAQAAARRRLIPAAKRICEIQEPDGAIPWFEEGPWDPWNHTEAAMALLVLGEAEAAEAAFRCLQTRQNPDGSWLGEYGALLPIVDEYYVERGPAPSFHDTNFSAYCAVGVWHRLLLTGDMAPARAAWPMVCRAMGFVLSLQQPAGDIAWSVEGLGQPEDDALLAGNACIVKSLDCAVALGRALGEPVEAWIAARARLIEALRERPERFDRRGSGARFAMDWYYPALTGALPREDARARLSAGAPPFLEPDRGCRCVSDEPWITVAETAELALALAANDERDAARRVLESQNHIVDESGVYWMGWQFEEDVYWPRERPSWTQAAVILAADALEELSPASRVLTHTASEAAEHAQAFHGFDFLKQS